MLTREQVVSVFTQVLGRVPDEREVQERLATGESLDDLLRMVLDSEEYAAKLREVRAESSLDHAVVNVFHPDLAEWGPSPGTLSDDGAAIVGREGWLFLCGGTNSNLGQHLGTVATTPGWLGEWRELIGSREALAHELGVASTLLVIPDKLAVYGGRYPARLEPVGPRPIERLTALPDLSIVYPQAELQAAAAGGHEVFIRTDTHLTFSGNELLFHSLLAGLGVEETPDFDDLPSRSYPFAGDLGTKFEPNIVSIVTEPNTLHDAVIVEDNRDEVFAVGGHIGTRRVFRNDRSPDPRTIVVFGDSFGFASPRFQGLSWFLAQVFREVHFVWVPFGWDSGYIRRVGAEAVLVQGAERFLGRVPHVEVDASELVAETLRRKRPIGIDRVSDDRMESAI